MTKKTSILIWHSREQWERLKALGHGTHRTYEEFQDEFNKIRADYEAKGHIIQVDEPKIDFEKFDAFCRRRGFDPGSDIALSGFCSQMEWEKRDDSERSDSNDDA